MHKGQPLNDMANEVPTRPAEEQAGGEPTTALENGAAQEGGSRDGLHPDEVGQRPQGELSWQEEEVLTAERNRIQNEERRLAKQEQARLDRLAAWKAFMQREQRDLDLRKGGQLARLLGGPQPGESPAALRRLSSTDQKQAEEELVTLMSNGKTSYKHIEELSEDDMPARKAAERLRTTWLKERRDGWLGHGGDYQ
ncbi:hypothetical protein BH24ACT21_BH24ACT21_15870 [soil metagenome]|jgi:hypothetical protein